MTSPATSTRKDFDPDCHYCDVDRHICPGCGDNLTHSVKVCADCKVRYRNDV